MKYLLLSHPSLGWLYVFSPFPPPPPRPRPPRHRLLLLPSKPFELDLRYFGQRKYGSGKMCWMTFLWPWPKVTAVTLTNKIFSCLQDKVRTTQLITTKLGSYIPLVMLITWLDFGGILVKTFFCQIFKKKFGCVFSRSNTVLDISQEWLVRLIWNEKEVHRLHTGWTMWPWPLTSLMTLTL